MQGIFDDFASSMVGFSGSNLVQKDEAPVDLCAEDTQISWFLMDWSASHRQLLPSWITHSDDNRQRWIGQNRRPS